MNIKQYLVFFIVISSFATTTLCAAGAFFRASMAKKYASGYQKRNFTPNHNAQQKTAHANGRQKQIEAAKKQRAMEDAKKSSTLNDVHAQKAACLAKEKELTGKLTVCSLLVNQTDIEPNPNKKSNRGRIGGFKKTGIKKPKGGYLS